jgi:hypothetical protein
MHTPSSTEAVRRELLVRSQVTGSAHRCAGVEFRLAHERAVAARSRQEIAA